MNDPKPTISRVVVEYTQDEDTSGRSGVDTQVIEIEMIRVEDGDDGHYVVFKTDRWSVNDPQEMAALIADFNTRCKNP